jgi:hypothetical protein
MNRVTSDWLAGQRSKLSKCVMSKNLPPIGENVSRASARKLDGPGVRKILDETSRGRGVSGDARSISIHLVLGDVRKT